VITDSERMGKEVVMDYYGTANIPELVWRKWREARGTYQNKYTKTGKDTCNWEEKLHIDNTVCYFITKGLCV
jgi:hypothetical protein